MNFEQKSIKIESSTEQLLEQIDLSFIDFTLQKYASAATGSEVAFPNHRIELTSSIQVDGICDGDTIWIKSDKAFTLPQLLWIVIHEKTHIISSLLEQRVLDENKQVTAKIGVSGVKKIQPAQQASTRRTPEKVATVLRDSEGQARVKTFNTAINEGLTELITEQIFSTYCNQFGISRGDMHGTTYVGHVSMARAYSTYLSILSGVPESEVTNSLIHTYLTNGEIIPEDEVIPELHIKQIALLLNSNNPAADKEKWDDLIKNITHRTQSFNK